MSWEVKEKSSVMFSEPNCEIVGSGKTLIDGVQKYVTILKRFDRQGLPFYEALTGAGRLFYNDPDNKSNPNSPDLSGKVTIDGETFQLGAWSKTAANGNSFLSMKLTEPLQKDDDPERSED